MKKVLFFIAFLFVLLPISFATADTNCSNNSEQQMLANFVKNGDSALDLYNFANANNLSKEKAKEILIRNFGDPQISKEEYFNNIARTHNPDEDLRIFALSNNLTKDEAKVILTQLFGEPEMP